MPIVVVKGFKTQVLKYVLRCCNSNKNIIRSSNFVFKITSDGSTGLYDSSFGLHSLWRYLRPKNEVVQTYYDFSMKIAYTLIQTKSMNIIMNLLKLNILCYKTIIILCRLKKCIMWLLKGTKRYLKILESTRICSLLCLVK